MDTPNSKCEVVVKDIDIPMRDGITLKATLLVKNDQLSHYTLLQRTPYARETSISLINALKLARNGWAVVIQSVRGREGSEGIFQPFIQEVDDGLDTINWISKQFWSNGKMAMSGASYVGFTQWCCAYSAPTMLKAISPQITSSNILNGWFYENGAFRNSFAQSWALGFAHTNPRNEAQADEAKHWAKNLEKIYNYKKQESPIINLFSPYCDWINKDNQSYWDKIPTLNKNNIPKINTFHLTGWYDIFCEGALSDFAFLNNQNTKTVTHRLIIGPWCHNTLLNNKVGELNFGYDADGFTAGIMDEAHEWLLNSLKGNPVKGGAKVFIMGENKWNEYPSWPPKSWESLKLYLSKQKKSSTQPLQTLAYNFPTSVLSTQIGCSSKNLPVLKGGRILDPLSLAGPFNHINLLNKSNNEALFVSDRFEKNLKIVGEISLLIFVNPESELNDISMSLLDIHPEGSAYNILTTTHRLNLLANNINRLSLSVGSIAFMFKKGHCIALRIATSNYPHLDIIDRQDSYKNNNIKIIYGKQYASYIKLPLQKNSL